MSDHATIAQVSLLEGHRLLTLAVFEPAPDDTISAVYEHALGEPAEAPAEPLIVARSWLTAVLPRAGEVQVFGSADGEVVFASEEEVEVTEASERAVSGLVEIDGNVVAITTAGEVLAVTSGGEVTAWKESGPALFAVAHVDGTTWIAGDSGYLARREGEAWSEVPTGTKESLGALARTAEGLVAVGNHGVVIHVKRGEATLRTVGTERIHGVATWRGAVVLAAGPGGLVELTADGTRVLRDGVCEGVAADERYLAIASGGAVLVTTDAREWQTLVLEMPDPDDDDDDDDDHEHSQCDHEH